MKIIKSPFKMKHQSPLNQNGDDKVVSSAGGTQNEITAYGMPVYDDSGNPISQEKMRYFENLNKLYPEHVYGKDSDMPGFTTHDMDGKTVLMPKSTSVSHWPSATKPGEKFYTKGMDSLSTLPGYKTTIDGEDYFK